MDRRNFGRNTLYCGLIVAIATALQSGAAPVVQGDVAISIDGTKPGRALPNVQQMLTLWYLGKGAYADAKRNAEWDVTEFAEYVEIMGATGGSPERDCFKNPADRTTLTDYDFSRLVSGCRNIVRLGMKPYLKLGNVPGKFTADYNGGAFSMNIRPPVDFSAYGRYMAACAKALLDAFGRDELLKWRFAVLTEFENADWFKVASGNADETFRAYCRLYEVTAEAFTRTVSPEIVIGAHAMAVTEGLWDERKFIRYAAEKKLPLKFVTASFYDHSPGRFTRGSNLPRTIAHLRDAAVSAGLMNLFYGVDEGRILVGARGANNAALGLRIIGDIYQAAYDARVVKQMFDADAEYFASWGYLSGPDTFFEGLPSVSFHVAKESARFKGMRRLPATAAGATRKDVEANAVAALSANGGAMRIMAYAFKNEQFAKGATRFRINAKCPADWAGREITVTRTQVDDDANWFDEWRAERAKRGIGNDRFVWSPDAPAPMNDLGLKSAADREMFRREIEPKLRECAKTKPVVAKVKVGDDGTLTLDCVLPDNAVVFFEAAVPALAKSPEWDATKSGRLMTATNDIVLFKGVSLADFRLAKCWFNKAGRRRADGTPAMCKGMAKICHVTRSADGRSLEAQCQVFDSGYTKCVKIRLSQRGGDIVGRVLYARYHSRCGEIVVGVDFDTLKTADEQPAYSVLPNGRVTNGYNLDWIALREIGSADDNIPEAVDGTMPEDSVMEWMESAVEPAAWTAYKKARPAQFRLFGEDRHYAVRNNIVPAHWLAKGNRAAELFKGKAQPGEFYPFQVCVASDERRTLRWSAGTELKVTRITPETCEVEANGVKPIWVMVDIPKDAAGKTFRGTVTVVDAKTGWCASLPFEIAVAGKVLEDGGISDAWRLSRLKWLNSDAGREDTVTKPYIPVSVDAATRTVRLLGRELVLGKDGLPAQIVSHFSGSNARIEEKGFNLLSKPFAFTEGGLSAPSAFDFKFTEMKPTCASWRAETSFGNVRRIVEGRMDFSGTGFFRIRHEGAKVAKASLEIRMPADVARFKEGLGCIGGNFAPGEKMEQKWDERYSRDSMWMGRVNGGLAVRFRGANYRRPLINAYYAWRRIKLPESWASGGGTLAMEKLPGGEATARASGLDAPGGAEWNFELYLTPFHCVDMKAHLSERYFHFGQRRGNISAEELRKAGVTVVNLHHNTVWNPYINYPYNDDGGPFLRKAVKSAHDAGLLLKVYYTTRELTQNLPEFFALKSLDGEVLLKRDTSVPGWPVTNGNGPHPWLCQHVGTDILPAWRENVRFSAYPNRLDLAVITTPDTRWDNFYLAGLDYLVREYGIDGLYIDDTALTGVSMQRARRILDRDGKRRLVDNHSWNHHSPYAGANSTNLAFIDLYPYFDLLWRGEGFSNNTPSDFWLMERSGLAFGLPGEMLGRGNPFRGLLFGMTDRWGWGGNPRSLWKFFDEVGLGDMELVGWWDDDCPVKVSGASKVKASVWKGKGRIVLVVANFANAAKRASFTFDAAKLGFDGAKAAWSRPEIGGVQSAASAPDFSAPVEIPAAGGLILVK